MASNINANAGIFNRKICLDDDKAYRLAFSTLYRYKVSDLSDPDELMDMRLSCLFAEAVLTEWPAAGN
jgi:hypothetical protein